MHAVPFDRPPACPEPLGGRAHTVHQESICQLSFHFPCERRFPTPAAKPAFAARVVRPLVGRRRTALEPGLRADWHARHVAGGARLHGVVVFRVPGQGDSRERLSLNSREYGPTVVMDACRRTHEQKGASPSEDGPAQRSHGGTSRSAWPMDPRAHGPARPACTIIRSDRVAAYWHKGRISY